MHNFRLSISIFFWVSLLFSSSYAIRHFPSESSFAEPMPTLPQFVEAPEYRNGRECPDTTVANNPVVHIAMTLDLHYLRGSMAAVHSVLKHALCPNNVFFHFIASSNTDDLTSIILSSFPSLNFKVYLFDNSRVKDLISSSIREALENPLNYARNYLSDMISQEVDRVIYLDSDVVVVDDIWKLWNVSLSGSRVIGAPEYCHANFTKYFTKNFWSNPKYISVFEDKNPCYFNTGVMVIDLGKWREGKYTKKIENWMKIQKKERLYELGSLPPFLLVFGGEIEAIEHRWNQHGLGGDNVVSSCRSLHPGSVSLMHWSGKGKPWVRLDEGVACAVDYMWAPYDLHKASGHGDLDTVISGFSSSEFFLF